MNVAPLSFGYHLPTTYVHVSGTVTTTRDAVGGGTVRTVQALATATVAADPLARLTARFGVDPHGTADHTWKLTPDGRVQSVATKETVARLGAWPAVARIGSFALAAALPLLTPGPAGLLASLAAVAAGAGKPDRTPPGAQPASREEPSGGSGDLPLDPALAAYEKAGHDALLLVALRGAVSRAAHAQAAALASDEVTEDELAALIRATRAVERLRPALERAEAEFRAWRAAATTTTVEEFDERFRIEDLPSAARLRAWASAGATDDGAAWARFAATWGVAVSVDLPDADARQPRPSVADPGETFEPASREGVVWWRPPRAVTLTAWRVGGAPGVRTLTRLSTTHLDTPVPGNERELSLHALGNTGSVALTFADNGALVEVGSVLTGSGRQVSGEVESVLTGLSDGSDAGAKVRDALALPTAEEQVKAKEALAKLAPAEPKPQSPEAVAARKELEAAQQRARLRVAQQLAEATSPPQIVVYATTS
jgi:hypothetical protein